MIDCASWGYDRSVSGSDEDLRIGPLEKKEEAVVNVIWRFLEWRGYVALFAVRFLL